MGLTIQDIRDAAFLSVAAYSNGNPSGINQTAQENLQGSGWTFVSPTEFGFFDVVDGYFDFHNAQALLAKRTDPITGEVTLALAFRGTSDLTDLLDDLLLGTIDITGIVYNRYSNLVDAIINNGQAVAGADRFLIAGHSLGGAMAEEVLGKYSSSKIVGVSFGSPGTKDASVPNSPGSDPRLINFGHVDISSGNSGDPVVRAVIGERVAGSDLRINLPDESDYSLASLALRAAAGLDIGQHDKFLYRYSTTKIAAALDLFHFDVRAYKYVIGTRLSGDTLAGSSNDDVIIGDAKQDGEATASHARLDVIHGNNGNDIIDAGGSSDIVYGDAGNDIVQGGDGNDTLNGGTGIDTVTYVVAASAVTVSLASSIFQTTFGAGEDKLSGFENVTGSAFDDRLTGSGIANVLKGLAGNDTLDGGAAADTLQGGNGDDTYIIDNIGDIVDETGSTGVDLVKSTVAWSLSDTVHVKGEIENLTLIGAAAIGGTGNALDNKIVGNDNANVLKGLDGADTLEGGKGADKLHGGRNGDTLTGGLNNDTFVFAFGDGTDVITDFMAGGIDDAIDLSAFGSIRTFAEAMARASQSGNDTIFDFGNDDQITLKNVLLSKLTVADFRFLGATVGQIAGAAGDDIKIGTAKDDALYGNAGNDTLVGNQGYDLLDGGAGYDKADYGREAGEFRVLVNLSDSYRVLSGTFVAAHQAIDTFGNRDSLVSIENVRGTLLDDVIVGNAASNMFNGVAGADSFDGDAGSDTVDYREAGDSVIIDLADASRNAGEAEDDTFISIENLIGSDSSDELYGDSGRNTLEGRGSADFLNGRGNFDYASYRHAASGVVADLTGLSINVGDAAGDTYASIEGLIGSKFGDTLIGDGNRNWLVGGEGADTLNGGSAFDYASYAYAALAVTASLEKSTINTGEAKGDTYISIEGLYGTAFNDRLTGNAGENWLEGGTGADVLDGRDGFDYASYYNSAAGVRASLVKPADNTADAKGDTYVSIEGLSGSNFDDVLTGNAGNNYLVGQRGADTLDGREGFDYAVYFNATEAVKVNLGNASENTGEAAGDTFISIEGLLGSSFGDTLIGNSRQNGLFGLMGNDRLVGGDGYDYVSYDLDTWHGGSAGVSVNLLTGQAIDGFGDTDTLENIHLVIATRFSDSIIGGNGDDQFMGFKGADFLDGGAGTDAADYSYDAANGGSRGIVANLAAGTIVDGFGDTDTVTNIDIITGTSAADVFVGDSGFTTFRGLGGADSFDGGDSHDKIDYSWDIYYGGKLGVTVDLAKGTATDGFGFKETIKFIEQVTATNANDVLVGESGSNILVALSGADTLDGRGGSDVLVGGSGNDTFIFRRGEANGDLVYDFAGSGALAGDALKFVGYGSKAQGATFTRDSVDPLMWHIKSANGLVEDIYFQTNVTIHASDYIFA